MNIDYKRNFRKVAGLAIAIIMYYVIHEGAHLIYALFTGVFKQINFIQMGVQIETYREQMSDVQTGIFCLVGAISTLSAGWILTVLAGRIVECRSLFFRAAAFYITLVFLLNDPFYLSVFYPYVGGGDMNGIKLIIPEAFARAGFAALFAVNLILVVKWVYPVYKKAFSLESVFSSNGSDGESS